MSEEENNFENPLRTVSDSFELNKINDFMKDEQVNNALLKLTTVLANPDLQPAKISKHIVQCQAMSAYFAMKATFYMGIGKDEPDAAKKKNVYFTMKEQFDKLAQSLKYVSKGGF